MAKAKPFSLNPKKKPGKKVRGKWGSSFYIIEQGPKLPKKGKVRSL